MNLHRRRHPGIAAALQEQVWAAEGVVRFGRRYRRWLPRGEHAQASEFFGIGIYMYSGDYGPPHFHARYGGEKASIAIADLSRGGRELATESARLGRRVGLASAARSAAPENPVASVVGSGGGAR